MANDTQDMPAKGQDDTQAQAKDWGNYWDGRAATDAGAALVGVGVESNAELEAFWGEVFSKTPKSARVLDVACGAGTVLRTAKAAGLSDLTGADISEAALASLAKAVEGVTAVVASADALPFPEHSFDLITSQFGMEYAGAEGAARSLAPLVAKGGEVVLVCHLTGGAISEEVAGKLAGADAVLESGFVEAAKAVFEANDDQFAAAAKAFGPAQDAVLALAKAGNGMAAHLYAGTQQLHAKRKAYELSDIFGWLDGMAGEVEAFRGRMGGMLAAALSDDEVAHVANVFAKAGLIVDPAEKLSLSGKPAAWVIRARRG